MTARELMFLSKGTCNLNKRAYLSTERVIIRKTDSNNLSLMSPSSRHQPSEVRLLLVINTF